MAQQLADGGDRPLADAGLRKAIPAKSLGKATMAIEQQVGARLKLRLMSSGNRHDALGMFDQIGVVVEAQIEAADHHQCEQLRGSLPLAQAHAVLGEQQERQVSSCLIGSAANLGSASTSALRGWTPAMLSSKPT